MKMQPLLTLPPHNGTAEARTPRLLHAILICVEISLAIYAAVLPFVAWQHIGRLWLLAAGTPVLVFSHYLVYRGWTRLAEVLLVWTLWVLITISTFTSDGVHSPTFFTYTIVILLAGLLIERWAGIAFAAASALVGLIMLALLEQPVHLPSDSPLDLPLIRWLLGSLTFAITAILQYVEVSNLSEALERARTNERAWAESNQALQARTQEVEEAAAALRQNEAQLRTLVRGLPDLIVRQRADGVILDIKSPLEFVTGFPIQHAIGRNIQDYFPAELTQSLLQLFQQALATRETQIFEHSIPVAGETRWRESRILALEDDEVLVIVRDITQRKQALETLHRSEERYRKLVELSPDAILLYRDQQVLFANPAGLALWGANVINELTGKPLPELFDPNERQKVQTWAKALLEHEEVLPNSAQKILRLDGSNIDVEVAAVVYHEQDGVAIQAIYRDVTERKQAEAKNQQLLHEVAAHQNKLRALNTRLARMEENERKRLSHELHDRVAQNLTGLNLTLNVLQRQLHNELTSESRVHSRLQDAITLVEQATVQIRNVMADLRPPVLDDYGLLATLEWYAAQLTALHGLPITVHGEAIAPRPPEYVELTLFRIVQEALTNVVKHAQATEATVMLTYDNQCIYVTIDDDGKGMQPAPPEQPVRQQNWGLMAMRERAETIGGHCLIESNPLGTSVKVEVQR